MTIAFTLPGGFPVFAFSLLVGAAAAFGLDRMHRSGPSATVGFSALILALVGARIGFTLMQPDAPLLERPLGGLSWAGALAGGIAGGALAARVTGRSIRRTADRLVPLAAALTAAAWLGCWLDGCAYGPESAAWFALPARDEWGNLSGRLPVQAAGALLAVLTGLLAARLHARPGLAGGTWLAFTGLQFWWLHALRADPAPLWYGLRPDLWASAAAAALGVILFLSSFTAPTFHEPTTDTHAL